MTFTTIILFICLFLVFWQDLKNRTIHVLLPMLIFTTSYYLISLKSNLVLVILGTNVSFFIITFSILIIYMSLKSKKFLNPFAHYFGLGDFLFYISISPLFYLKNYIIYFILSMVFAILVKSIFNKKISTISVPLAGLSSFLLAVLIIFDLFLCFKKITLLKF